MDFMGPAVAASNITSLNVADNYLYKNGGIEAVVSMLDNGALSVANVMGNTIGKEQLAKLQEIMRSKPNLQSLCGIADGATEADLSGLGMDADDAIILASELPDKGAMSVFTFDGGYMNSKPVTIKTSMTEADFSGKNLGGPGAIMLSAFLPKCK
jgi:hypothetical protein